jgi:hypothetical protein
MPLMPRFLRLSLFLPVFLTVLAGCDPVVPPVVATRPDGPAAALPPASAKPSAASNAMRDNLERVQTNLLTQGLLRTDGGGPDTPFTARNLADNFLRIAMYDEYVADQGSLVARTTESRLRRWEQPIRMNVEFGASVPEVQRSKDRTTIGAFAARLARLTGLSIQMSDYRPNYTILVLNEDERRGYGPRVAQIVPGIDGSALRAISDMPPSTYCVVFAFSAGSGAAYTQAVAVIRGEHPDLLRLSCVHEELAQGLGLANDSPAARPSIFNDDEEFGLLTTQDEMMLRILYDRRLRTGMTLAQARPIVEVIANELIGGES